MYSTTWRHFLITIPLVYSAQIFATETNALQKESILDLKSLLPLSTHPLNATTIKKLKENEKRIKSNDKPHAFLKNEFTYGGGYGGNEKTGPLFYDGLPNHMPALTISRDAKNETCYLENQNTSVYQYKYWWFLRPVSYECSLKAEAHNEVYWNDRLGEVNGSYSPANDALYAGKMINAMYSDWFGIPAIQNADGSPAPIEIIVHMDADSAFADKGQINLGDGSDNFYPLTSPGVISFLVAYIFTNQHANPEYDYFKQSTAIGIAFSAMADQAIKFYINGQNDWEIGREISKTDTPIYYFDQPSKDCGSSTPGDNCSIDHLSQYKDKTDPFFSSGLYRRAFYLLATTPNWDVKKTFSIMVQANRFYWTKNLNFSQGVCGLIKAARDYHYDEIDVINAFSEVGINAPEC